MGKGIVKRAQCSRSSCALLVQIPASHASLRGRKTTGYVIGFQRFCSRTARVAKSVVMRTLRSTDTPDIAERYADLPRASAGRGNPMYIQARTAQILHNHLLFRNNAWHHETAGDEQTSRAQFGTRLTP